MPAPMSLDLRERIVRAVEGGSSIREATRRFAVSPSAAIKLMQRVRTTGSAAPPRFGGHRRRLLAPHEADLRRLVATRPDITLVSCRPRSGAGSASPPGARRSTTPCVGSASGLKKVAESGRAGPPGHRSPAPALARLAALHAPRALRVRPGPRPT
jgi:hypothetical protein